MAPCGAPVSDTSSRIDECLRRSRILVVGVGGLGAPAVLQLAAAGVGTLGLIDFDRVEISNLHRQIIYRTTDIGRPKARIAAERVARLNPRVSVRCFDERLSPDNLLTLFPAFDFVIDATDQIAAKYLINDGAVLCRVPFSHAGIVGFQGQTMTVLPGRSACFRCLFPVPPPAEELPTCQEAGVLGVLGGSIGLVQATEALKFVTGVGSLLTNRLLSYDALAGRWRTVVLQRSPHCPVCGDNPSIRRLELIGGHDGRPQECT